MEARPEFLENKSERLQARPTLLHSSAMVGHRVGFTSSLHCKAVAVAGITNDQLHGNTQSAR